MILILSYSSYHTHLMITIKITMLTNKIKWVISILIIAYLNGDCFEILKKIGCLYTSCFACNCVLSIGIYVHNQIINHCINQSLYPSMYQSLYVSLYLITPKRQV